ncbi:WD repeat protein [Rasamsonia emersonii CBS 393.64]|uniref:Mitochondrial division protein 1 n=1 Tax=Rasamsonia emersonii (strain ATCC 16479 / CBS 393.64 / IMI 116815) TaxID=1408163 RepID=A0A0F4YZU8_RASE3|nr:WD repeat protein [Rasamsonia emersonii CBS 393.64]KKA23143.1 WD repeat protein [Rasamsonia emersonii CBS 393.64]
MENGNHPPKRRRLNNGYAGSPTSSSSDELAATSDHEMERRRASWSAKKAYTARRRYNRRSHSFSDSGSPDELAVDADTYWGRNTREQSRSPSRSRSRSASRSSRSSSQDDSTPEQAKPEESAQGDDDAEEGSRPRSEQQSERIPSPPPPPPKPDHLNYREKFLLKGHLRGVSAVQFSPDGSKIASGGADGALKVWDTLTGKLIHTFEGHLAGISTVAWSPDGETIASGSDDKSIRLWNVLTGKAHPVPFNGHHNYVYSLAFSPKGNMLISGSYDEAVFLWDVRSARVMRSLPAHSDPVAGVDVVWDGTLIVSCSSDGLIRLWDTATGQCLRTLVHEDNPPGHGGEILAERQIRAGVDSGRLCATVELRRGTLHQTYQGHINRKYSLCGGFGIYSAPGGPPSAFVVSGSEDGAVLCWDVVSKNVLQRLEGHTDAVLCVDTCSFEGKRLMVSCGLDRTIRVWEEVEEVVESREADGTETNGEKMEGTSQEPAQTQDGEAEGDGDKMIE